MKAFTVIAKVLVALAAVAGAVYVAATYGDKIVAWCKKLLNSCPCCCDDKCECCSDGECTCEGDCECCEETPVEEVPAEEVSAEEAPVEEAPVEEAPADETVPVADEADFEG